MCKLTIYHSDKPMENVVYWLNILHESKRLMLCMRIIKSKFTPKSIQNRPNRLRMWEEKMLATATVKIVLDSLSMPFATRRKNIENTGTLVCKPDLQTLCFQVTSFSMVMAILDMWCLQTCWRIMRSSQNLPCLQRALLLLSRKITINLLRYVMKCQD